VRRKIHGKRPGGSEDVPWITEIARSIQASGDLSALDGCARINLKTASEGEFRALLELSRFRAFGHRMLADELDLVPAGRGGEAYPGPGPVSAVEWSRNLTHGGRFRDALDCLEREGLGPSDPERELEQARALIFLGRFAEALELLRPLAGNREVALPSMGVALQMTAAALMETGMSEERVKPCLRKALSIAEAAGNHLGLISARLYLAKHAMLGEKFDEARDELAQALGLIKAHRPGLRWVLGYYRTASHLRFLDRSRAECARPGAEAGKAPAPEKRAPATTLAAASIALASHIGDRLYEARGWVELQFMSDLADHPRAAAALSEADVRGSDLPLWVETLRGGPLPQGSPRTLKAFQRARARLREVPPAEGIELGPDQTRISWILDREANIVVHLPSGELAEVPASGVQERLLALLAASPAPLPVSRVFEAIWGLRYFPERHQATVAMTISRLNRECAGVHVSRKGGLLSVGSPGLVL
jgi:tetratricopeptide (TPR) repeat protein